MHKIPSFNIMSFDLTIVALLFSTNKTYVSSRNSPKRGKLKKKKKKKDSAKNGMTAIKSLIVKQKHYIVIWTWVIFSEKEV